MRRLALIPRIFDRPGSDGLPAEVRALHQQVRDRLRAYQPPRPLASRRRAPAASIASTAIVGLAAPTLKLRHDDAMRGQYRVFQPYAFSAALVAGRPIRALLDHDGTDCLATTSDRLSLLEDDRGLWFRLELRDAALDREALALVQSGRCGVSPGWYNRKSENRTLPTGEIIEHMDVCDLFEISLVDQPAFQETAAWLDTTGRSLRALIRDGAMTGRSMYESAASQFSRALHSLAASVARAG